jgi:hypothetical protein
MLQYGIIVAWVSPEIVDLHGMISSSRTPSDKWCLAGFQTGFITDFREKCYNLASPFSPRVYGHIIFCVYLLY